MRTFSVDPRRLLFLVLLPVLSICTPSRALADASSASLSVSIADTSGAVVADAHVVIRNSDTNQEQQIKSGKSGLAAFSFLKPGHYTLTVSKASFADVVVDNIILNVGDGRHLRLVLKVGTAEQTVSVDGSGPTINTTDASVSTVIDRKFVENTPLNGRSFQNLILLSPGVTTNSPQRTSNMGVSGEFAVNGQRTESNYYTVDGVSANSGASSITGAVGLTGSLPASTALGTTQGLVSVDALQEFRMQTSTYSAEYGRNPGGQFSMVTRSGTNDWHGTAFEYFRNDALDANAWFNNHTTPVTPKSAERQNDFGGTLGGPVFIPRIYNGKNTSFFFFSYEGLRLVQPQDVSINYVPDLSLRQSAPSPLNQLLNAFPLPTPNTPEVTDGLTEYIAGWSNPSSLDATSVRFDQQLGTKTHAFFRFSNTPSDTAVRGTSAITSSGTGISSPSVVTTSAYGSRTYTGGVSNAFDSRTSNDLRINFSSNDVSSVATIDSFGGATPINLVRMQGLDPTTTYAITARFILSNYSPGLSAANSRGSQKQWNIVDTISSSIGKHVLKLGVDWRRLSPLTNPNSSAALYQYTSKTSITSNAVNIAYGRSYLPAYPLYKNVSVFVQDDWHVLPRLSLAMGIRWEVNPAPGVSQGLMPYTVTGLNDLSQLALAPQGTSLWQTSWFNLAPRLGLAYTAHSEAGHETILRAGGGVFFDTGQQTGSYGFNGPGFTATNYFGQSYGTTTGFPVPQSVVTPTVVSPPAKPYGLVYANPPHLQLPYTYQWNASLEQALGKSQTFTISYVGANSRKLLQESALSVAKYNSAFSTLYVLKNGLTSSYNGLQLKFQRQIANGLQALVSYTWSHALDFGSYNVALPYQHGNSDQDVRHNFTAALSYDLPAPKFRGYSRILLKDWGVDGRVTSRSGFPVTINGNTVTDASTGELYYGGVNLIPGVAVYQYGSQYPGSRRVNPAAFGTPPTGQYGNAPRNFVRGFGAEQTDIAVRRQFRIVDQLHGQFRIEAFNVFNHPNFGTINSFLTQTGFGQATSSLAQSLGVLSPLYQMGGARSLQANLKLTF